LETEAGFCGEVDGLAGLVLNLFLNSKIITTAATISAAATAPTIMIRALDDICEEDDVSEPTKA
jgi:hypothetical protein